MLLEQRIELDHERPDYCPMRKITAFGAGPISTDSAEEPEEKT